jgi:hypothetical protein
MGHEETSFLNESDEESTHYNVTWMSSLDGEDKTTFFEGFLQSLDLTELSCNQSITSRKNNLK